MDRVRVLRAINKADLDLTLNEALIVADALHEEFSKPRQRRVDFSTHAGRVEWASNNPDVMRLLPDRKIQAIKKMREDSGRTVHLKDAKDAIDAVMDTVFPYRR